LSARVTCRLTVSYQANGQWHPATGIDLSITGCRVRLGEDLGRGSSIKVRIEAPDPQPLRVEVGGKVIWSRLEGLSYQAGIQFVTEEAILHQILHNLSPASPSAEDTPPAE
jgi:hypothetical protein